MRRMGGGGQTRAMPRDPVMAQLPLPLGGSGKGCTLGSELPTHLRNASGSWGRPRGALQHTDQQLRRKL